MPLSQGYTEYVLELLEGFGPLEVKRMFGGAGLYRDGVMFAILDNDALYVRVDDALQAELAVRGSVPWTYSNKPDGRGPNMAYWRLPDTAADDPEDAVAIARKSHAVSLARAEKRKPKPGKAAPGRLKPARVSPRTSR